MEQTKRIKRREFLQSSPGVVGLAALLGGVAQSNLLRAQTEGTSETKNSKAVEAVRAELEAKRGQYSNVPRKDGQFLNLMIKVARAQNVLEVGTSNGYSATWISSGLEETGGKMTTIEILPERVREAKENLKRAGLIQRITFLEGDAHSMVRKVNGPFDFVFIDADKGKEEDYFNNLFPQKLQPGGLILVHNAIRFRDRMKSYLDFISNHPQFDTVILSLTMEDGFAVSYRRRR